MDIGYILVVRTELQAASDGAALAAVQELEHGEDAVKETAIALAAMNQAGGKPINLSTSDIVLGTYDLSEHKFTAGSAGANAVRVTTHLVDQPLFFGPAINHGTFSTSRSATAMLSPRDIVFVVDLSGSMNDDTEPCWATQEITSAFGWSVANDMMQKVYDDFGYGTFPGVLQNVGEPLGLAPDNYALAEMTKDNG